MGPITWYLGRRSPSLLPLSKFSSNGEGTSSSSFTNDVISTTWKTDSNSDSRRLDQFKLWACYELRLHSNEAKETDNYLSENFKVICKRISKVSHRLRSCGLSPTTVLFWNYASSLARFSGNKPALEQRKSLFWGEKWEVGNAKWEIGEVGSRKLEAPLPLSYSLPILLTCSTESLVSEPAKNVVAVDKWAAELPPKWVKPPGET